MSGQIARWIHEDKLDPSAIKHMIDLFVADPTYLKKGIPPWKSFVNQRQALFEKATRVSAEQEREAHRHDSRWWKDW